MKNANSLLVLFLQIKDPRSHINRVHSLLGILGLVIVAVICGARTWKDIVEYGKSNEDFLKEFLDLSNGIPSENTLNRLISKLDSDQFEMCFRAWVDSLINKEEGRIIPLDGKTIRGAKSKGQKSPIHIVSAWSCENDVVLGQFKTNEKSNEITAIPELLKYLDITGSVVTIDAMGTQVEIAKEITERKADYVFAAKANQPTLLQNIEDEFRFSKNINTDTDFDMGHGRIETRTCSVISDLKFVNQDNKWPELKSVIQIDSIREFKNSEKKAEKSTRYYISSLVKSPEEFQKIIRSHWAIENKLHWTLDVTFGEDASRKRAGNAAQNFSTINKCAMNLLRNEKTQKQGMEGKRRKAGWDKAYLMKVLNLEMQP